MLAPIPVLSNQVDEAIPFGRLATTLRTTSARESYLDAEEQKLGFRLVERLQSFCTLWVLDVQVVSFTGCQLRMIRKRMHGDHALRWGAF